MALTPAQEYRQKKLAALAAEKNGESAYGEALTNQYALMMARLVEHQRSLKGIQSKEGKGRYKVHALKDFEGWINGVLENGTGDPDEIFSTMLIWSIDAGQYEQALKMAEYAIMHKMAAPDRFKRAIHVVLMDEVSNAAKAKKLGDEAASILSQVIDMTILLDSPDELKAKLLKMHAFALIGRLESTEINENIPEEDVVIALQELNRAFELDANVGVVKEQRKLESLLKKIVQDDPPTDDPSANTPPADTPAGDETKRAENSNDPVVVAETSANSVPPAPPAAHAKAKSQKPKAPAKKAAGKTSKPKA